MNPNEKASKVSITFMVVLCVYEGAPGQFGFAKEKGGAKSFSLSLSLPLYNKDIATPDTCKIKQDEQSSTIN